MTQLSRGPAQLAAKRRILTPIGHDKYLPALGCEAAQMPKHDDHTAGAFAGNVTEVDERLGRRLHSVAPVDHVARTQRSGPAQGRAANWCGKAKEEESAFIVSV